MGLYSLGVPQTTLRKCPRMTKLSLALIGLADSYIVMLAGFVLLGHPAGSTALLLSGTPFLIYVITPLVYALLIYSMLVTS